MTIPRFPLPDGQPINGEITLSGQHFRHLVRVLRAKAGDSVSFYDEDGFEYPSTVEKITRNEAVCINNQRIKTENKINFKISLCQGLLKKEKMDIVVEKASELGIYRVVPVLTERCEVRLSDDKIASRVKHWERIAEEATSQSRRYSIPLIDHPKSFKKAVGELKSGNINILLSENLRGKNLKGFIKGINPCNEISVFIGPPGGFSENEITLAEEKGLNLISLKGAILKSETAAISVLSILQYELGGF